MTKVFPLLLEDANDHLRIVASRNAGQNFLADLQNQTAARNCSGCDLFDQRFSLRSLRINQGADFPSQLDRINDQLEAFSKESPAFFALLFGGQSL